MYILIWKDNERNAMMALLADFPVSLVSLIS